MRRITLALILILTVGALAGAGRAAAAPTPSTVISGVLREAATGAPIRGGCAAVLAVGSSGSPSFTGIQGDGSWSIDPGTPGDYNVAFYATGTGNCADPITPSPVPSWYQNQPVAGNNPSNITAPAGAQAVAAGTTGIVACLGATALPTGCAEPITKLSGTVYAVGHVPVASACVFVIPSSGNVSGSITDPQGQWAVAGLPVGTGFVVGVVPPFNGPNGPCTTTNGPPPKPPAGALQPVFYKDIWIDLAAPALSTDTYTYALTLGATAITQSTARITVCLSTAAGNVVPRPTCDPPAPATTTTIPLPNPAPAATIPATGSNPGAPLGLAIAAIALGLAVIILSRRRARTT